MTSIDHRQVREQVEAQGWVVVPAVVSSECVDLLIQEVEPHADLATRRGGLRNLLDLPAVRAIAAQGPLREVAETVLGPDCVAVRGLLFDKTPEANWLVTWHQDLTVALAERVETCEGFGPWSFKEGVVHAVAPAEVLLQMLTIRLHLDSCGALNGPVRVIAGSHKMGKLGSRPLAETLASVTPDAPEIERGGLLVFRPLLLHASSPAECPAHRRVLHLEYASGSALPPPLNWRWKIRPHPDDKPKNEIL